MASVCAHLPMVCAHLYTGIVDHCCTVVACPSYLCGPCYDTVNQKGGCSVQHEVGHAETMGRLLHRAWHLCSIH